MKCRSLAAFCLVPLLQCSCSSQDTDKTTSPGASPTPKGNDLGAPIANLADGNTTSASFLWLSDKKGVYIEPCKVGQVMVDAQCWDEVHFKPTGVTLTKPGASFSFFENGALASDYLKTQYEYNNSYPDYENFGGLNDLPRKTFSGFGYSQISSWVMTGFSGKFDILPDENMSFENFRWNNYYNFAPLELMFSVPQEDNTLTNARLAKAEFTTALTGYYYRQPGKVTPRAWRVNGTLEVCGKVLNLATLIQKEIEDACGTGPVGAGPSFNLPILNGKMSFRFSPWSLTPSDDEPESIIYQLSFPDPTQATPPPP